MADDVARQHLRDLIVQYTDDDIVHWGDLQEDSCSYTAYLADIKLTVNCCQNSAVRRSLSKNDSMTSLRSDEVDEICKAIGNQKVRFSVRERVTDETIAALVDYKNSIVNSWLTKKQQ